MNLGTRGWSQVVGAVIVFGAVGCGGGSSGGSGTFATSVPASTKLTALTPTQAQQLCNDLDTFAQRSLSGSTCKLIGIEAALLLQAFSDTPATDAQLREACTQAYNGCLNPDGGATTTDKCDPATFTTQPTTCQATVGDVQACENDQAAAYQQAFASVPSCSSLTAASLASSSGADAGTTTTTEPASCTKFSSTCNTP